MQYKKPTGQTPKQSKMIQEAFALHQSGQLDEAETQYKKLLNILHSNTMLLTNLGTIAFQKGKLEDAIRIIGKSLQINPNQPNALNNRGNALKNLKRLDEALASYDRAIVFKPDYAEANNNRGVTLQELKRLDEALASYDRALVLKPDYAEAFLNRGNALKELKRLDEALASYDRAIVLKPDYADAYSNRGNALKELKRLDEALASFDRAIALKPDYADAYYNHGNILKDLQRLDEALASYDRAIVLKPDYAEAHSNRGNALKDLKRLDEALASYDSAIVLKPDYADAYSNRGITLQELKRLDEALASYDHAIVLNPDYAEAYCNRGNALKDLNRLDEALASYDCAIALKPDYAVAYSNRGNALADLLQPSNAKKSYLKALELNPDYCEAKWNSVVVNIPQICVSNDELQSSRDTFANELKQLDEWFASSKMNDAYKAVGIRQPFYLAYQELNNKMLLSQYGRLSNRLMTHWQDSNNIKPTIFSTNGKIKIGIVNAHIRNHSVWHAITKGLLFNIDANKFDVHVFNLGSSNDAETKSAKIKATTFTENQPSLEKWVSAILEKKIEVLIYPEVGMDQLTFQLASLRLAPLQLVTWGHPETTGLPTIDYYLSAKLFEDSHAQENYTEKLLALPNLGCAYSNLTIIPSAPDIGKLGIDNNYPILLYPGTLQKYAPQYDYLFIEIVKRLGKCTLVFFTSTKDRACVLRERLRKVFVEAELNLDDYVIFIPWLNQADFYGLMQRSDVFLDSIGFSGFNTAMQAIDCALPIVTREGQFMRGRLASGILKRMGMSELIANTEEEYITLVVRLVEDKRYRQEIAKKLQENKVILYNDLEPIQALERFLLHKCRFNN